MNQWNLMKLKSLCRARPAPEPERAAAHPGASLPMTEGRALFISVSFTQLLFRAAHRSPNLHEYLALYQG